MSYVGSPSAPKIAEVSDATVTPAKLSTGHPNWDSSGNVGIGTASPAVTLDVSGTIYSSGVIRNTNGGSAATPSIQPGNDADTGIYHPATNTIGFSTVGTERMRIDSSGRVTMPYQPAFYAYGAGVQYWSGTAAHQTLQLSVQASLGSRSTGYNTSTYTFTAPVAGTYVFFGRVTQQTTVTGPALFLYKNGVQVANELSIGYSTGYMTNGGFQLVQLAANDAVTLSAINYNNTSVTLDLTRVGFAGWLLG